MRYIFSILAIAMISLLAGCEAAKTTANKTVASNSGNAAGPANTSNAAAPAKVDEHGHEDNAPRITIEEAKKDFDAGNVVFVDTRAESQYKAEHIKGAISLPIETAEARWKELPKDKKIIAYCS